MTDHTKIKGRVGKKAEKWTRLSAGPANVSQSDGVSGDDAKKAVEKTADHLSFNVLSL